MIDEDTIENRPLGMAGWGRELRFIEFGQSHDEVEQWKEWQASLKPWDPRHDGMFEITDDGTYALIFWSGGEYPLDLTNIDTPEQLLWSVMHIGKKLWRHITARRLTLLMQAVCREKGWQPYGRQVKAAPPAPHPNEAPPPFVDPAAERAKVTPQIRYDVIKRDGYRCRCCGASVNHGASLHVDHIHPVSKGGLTVESNLQTLCWACNMGKGAKA